MKMIPTYRVIHFFIIAFVLELPASVAAGGLRGNLLRPSALQPLQRPPPATADVAFAQLESEAALGQPLAPSPMGAWGPAPGPSPLMIITMPPKPKLPDVTAATCKAVEGKVAQIIGASVLGGPAPGPMSPYPAPMPAPGPAPAALLEEETAADFYASAPAPGPGGAGGPTVECFVYALVSKQPVGCTCLLLAKPPPAAQPMVQGCPNLLVADSLAMGFTGNVVQNGPMSFGARTAGVVSHTCMYRQWLDDPAAHGPVRDYQMKLGTARTEKYIINTYAASMRNAHNTVSGYWALTPMPWLKMYPTTPWPVPTPLPLFAGAPAPGMGPTTPPIVNAPPPTTPPIPTTPNLFGTTTGMYGAATTPSPYGAYGATTTAFR